MKIPQPCRSHQNGYALPTVVLMAGIAVALYASIHSLTESSVRINSRNNVYNQTLVAAEGASEHAMAHIMRDFLNQSYNPANLAAYQVLIPTNAWAADYGFCDGQGQNDRVYVSGSATSVSTNLESQFKGLYGLVYSCTIRGQARALNTPFDDIQAAVQQELQLASIPIFQFAIFYSMDLEINPGPVMNVTGKVHGNANLYLAPVNGLTFLEDVAATGSVFFHRHPDDPTGGSKVKPVFTEPYVENVSSLSLPIATNNSPEVVRGILEEPPFGESSTSPAGKHRYYNNCDLLIVTTPEKVTVTAGAWNGFAALSPDVNAGQPDASYSFVQTNQSFYDKREAKHTIVTELNVSKLKTWMNNAGAGLNNQAKATLGHHLNSVYILDKREASGKLTVVRVTDGKELPPSGLTIATKRPMYVEGHFNSPNTTVGSTDTSATKPASLVADAITVLSANWDDTKSAGSMQAAKDTTINAALLAGIVPTTNYFGSPRYSGGVENFPRFLESWSNKSLTYNGSMVVMFPSQYATGFWQAPGAYYNAPTRRWAFDVNFLDHRKLPPATPQVRKLVRGQWKVVAAR